jgi:hypothetical protein
MATEANEQLEFLEAEGSSIAQSSMELLEWNVNPLPPRDAVPPRDIREQLASIRKDCL